MLLFDASFDLLSNAPEHAFTTPTSLVLCTYASPHIELRVYLHESVFRELADANLSHVRCVCVSGENEHGEDDETTLVHLNGVVGGTDERAMWMSIGGVPAIAYGDFAAMQVATPIALYIKTPIQPRRSVRKG